MFAFSFSFVVKDVSVVKLVLTEEHFIVKPEDEISGNTTPFYYPARIMLSMGTDCKWTK